MTLPPQGTGSPDDSVPATSPGVLPETPPGWQGPPGWQAPPMPPQGWQGPPGWQAPSDWQAPPGWQGAGPRRDRGLSGRAIFAIVLVVAIAFAAGGAVGLSQGSVLDLSGSTS